MVENELNFGSCVFCLKDNGMKLQCSEEKCKNCYHPICAYLYGVHFDMDRTYNGLNTVLTCSEHLPERNVVHQIYLRRFFCDFNNTSKLTDIEFEVKHQAETEKRMVNIEAKVDDNSLGILKKGKFIKPTKTPTMRSKCSSEKL